MRHGDLNWEGRILALQHQLRGLGPAPGAQNPVFSPDWHHIHEAFHDALADACPNDWWLRLRRQLFMQSERYRRYSGPLDLAGRDVTLEHDNIVSAALGKDEDAASKAMSAHLWGTTNLLLASDLPFSEN
jgi:DNA-binding GntR family transcriptional regulator